MRINAKRFIRILSKDPLFENTSMLKHIINTLSLRYDIKINFCNYLYGVNNNPIAYTSFSITYNRNAVADIVPSPPLQSEVYSFKPLTSDLKAKLNDTNKKKENSSNYTTATEKLYLSNYGNVIKNCYSNNNIHTQFLTTLLSTGLQFYYKNEFLSMSIGTLFNFIENRYDGCLLEALDNIILTKPCIAAYFTDNNLPLPTALYPNESHSTSVFCDNYKTGAWDEYNPYEYFGLFYSITKDEVHEEVDHASDGEILRGDSMIIPGNQLAKPESKKNAPYAFYKSGQVWITIFNGKENTFRHVLGFSYLNQILQAKGKGISLEDLEILTNGQATTDGDPLFLQKEELKGECPEIMRQKIEAETRIDITQLLEHNKDEEMELNDKYSNGRIDKSEYEESLKDIKKKRAKIYNLNRKDSKIYKRFRDRTTKAIGRALADIKQCDVKLHDHLKLLCKYKNGKFLYKNPDDIQWKLHE